MGWEPHRRSGVRRQFSIFDRSEVVATPLTFEEFIAFQHSMTALIPSWNGALFERVVRRVASKSPAHQAAIESQLPELTQAIVEKAERLVARGLQLPPRFLPSGGGSSLSKEQVLALARELYTKFRAERAA